jgi:small GTP-binding protein
VATGSEDTTIRLWDIDTGQNRLVIEGHASHVYGLSYSYDDRVLASQSFDGTIRLWHGETGAPLATLPTVTGGNLKGIAFHPTEPWLAARDEDDKVIRIWCLDFDLLLKGLGKKHPVRYTTAKIPLVGDQLVGKTTLGHRLITGEYKLFPRTHGQQFWVFPGCSTKRSDGTECEAILWDLAGQPDYRLTHSLFLDDANLALVLFNASDRQQPLKGVEYWIKALRHRRGSPCPAILVASQKDTGDVSLTDQEMEAFCRNQGVAGGYVATSAATGEGVQALLERIKQSIGWDQMTPTITTVTFKRIKEFVLGLKANADTNSAVLITPAQLEAKLRNSDASFTFTEAEMMTAVGHVANHGYVTLIRTSDGQMRILLMPDLLINLTASLVLEARQNHKGLGAMKESDVLQGRIPFPELERFSREDRGTLLDAAVALFVEHTICFRETLGTDSLLVFPALIHERKPQVSRTPTVDDVSYLVDGAIEHIYSSMVVLLGYTNTFARSNQWHNQAEYETAKGQICGFRQLDSGNGQVSLVLYYGSEAESHTRLMFEGLFETFLLARQLRVTKFPAVRCQACGYQQERDEIVKRITTEKGFIRCAECGERVGLPKVGEALGNRSTDREALRREQETARQRTTYETALSRFKGLIRDRNLGRRPTCFVSYAWGNAVEERWVAVLVEDLQKADIDVVFDKNDNAAPGSNIARFLSDGLSQSSMVVVVGTPLYLDKCENRVSTRGSIVAAEMDLILQRLTGNEAIKASVLPLLLDGNPEQSLPPLLRGRVYSDFRVPTDYFAVLFDLVLTVHGIPIADSAVADLREQLRPKR